MYAIQQPMLPGCTIGRRNSGGDSVSYVAKKYATRHVCLRLAWNLTEPWGGWTLTLHWRSLGWPFVS